MWYPPPDITPKEFEEWVAALFESTAIGLDYLTVTPHERLEGTDGSFVIDATVRYGVAGMEFLVLVEAKLHKKPVQRGLVQELLSKIQSVGAHKGVMVSTSGFQRGALEFAKVHGIALVSMTEGRFTYQMRAASPRPVMSRDEAKAIGLPTFVGHCYEADDRPGTTNRTLISVEYPEYVRELLLGIPTAQA